MIYAFRILYSLILSRFTSLSFLDIVRSSDFGTFAGHQTITHTGFDLEESDFFRVYCQSASGKM